MGEIFATCYFEVRFLMFSLLAKTFQRLFTWGDDEANRPLGPFGNVKLKDLAGNVISLGTWRNERKISTSPFGGDKADARIYGDTAFAHVIGRRSEDLH